MGKDFGNGYDGNPKRYFGNISRGYVQGIYEVGTTQNAPLGAVIEYMDGRKYVYTLANGTAAAGVLVARDQSAQSVVEIDGAMTAAAIGDTEVTITNAALDGVVANQFAGGLLQITDDAGEGHQYYIMSNTADGGSDDVVFTLADGLVVAVTTASDCAIVGNRSNEVVIASAGTDYNVVGVTPVAVADGEYFWRQVAGDALVLVDGTIAAGDQVSLSDDTNGAVQVLGGGGSAAADILAEQDIGTMLYAPDSTGHGGVMLKPLG